MSWYAKQVDSGQGLVIDEDTGDTIAVAYDGENANVLAAAPELLELAKLFRGTLRNLIGASSTDSPVSALIKRLLSDTESIIYTATDADPASTEVSGIGA